MREGYAVPAIVIVLILLGLQTTYAQVTDVPTPERLPAQPVALDVPTSFGFGTLIGIQVADLATTHLVVRRGGVEVNPLMRGGFAAQLAIKAGVTTAAWMIASRIKSPIRKRVFVYSMVGIYSATVANNIRQLQKIAQ